jgi:Galactose oxidase, central domain
MMIRPLRVLVLLSVLTAAVAGSIAGCESDAASTCESGNEDAGTSGEDAGQDAGDGGALYDPVWKQVAPMHAKRGKHAAVKLPDGLVLVVGPPADSGPIAEVYDAKKDVWTDVAPPNNPLTCPPVMVALSDGRALAVFNGFAEVYTPSTKSWSDVTPTSPLSPWGYTGCETKSAYSLVTPRGRRNPVLIAPDAVWEFDVKANELTPKTPPPDPSTSDGGVSVEGSAVAVEPFDGTVLVAGGFGYCKNTQEYRTELDGSDSWSPGATMNNCHVGGVAVGLHPYFGTLVVGGESNFGIAENASVEVFSASSWSSLTPMANPRSGGHTATELPSGQVLFIGGSASSTAEVFDPNSYTWSSLESEGGYRFFHHASTLLDDGRVLVTGGQFNATNTPFELESDRAFLCTPSRALWQTVEHLPPLDEFADAGPSVGSPAPIGRVHHTATKLSENGDILVAGGGGVSTQFIVDPDSLGGVVPLSSSLSYDPHQDIWRLRGAMNAARVEHEAARLGDGRVLVVGGDAEPKLGWTLKASTVEIFEPAKNGWSVGSSLPVPPPEPGDKYPPFYYVGPVTAPASSAWTRTGALVPFGPEGKSMLLLASRTTDPNAYPTDTAALFFDLEHGQWTAAPTSLHAALVGFTATLIPPSSRDDGVQDRVLVAGGVAPNNGSNQPSAYLFDPASKTWTPTKSGLEVPRFSHTATWLPKRLQDGEIVADGRVLVVGGRAANTSFALTECEIYDPRDDSFHHAAPLAQPRWGHQAIVLDDTGRVLVVGGAQSNSVTVNSAELYDPDTDTWTPVQHLADARWGHSLTLLDNGSVLAIGGANFISSTLDAVERFTAQPPGRACAFDTDCSPDETSHVGRCVEGVCCDGACDDGCHACSIKRGASQDGHCEDISVSRCGKLACDVDTGCKPCSTERDCTAGLVCNPEGDCVKPPARRCDVSGTSCSTSVPPPSTGSSLLPAFTLAACVLVARRRRRHL